MNKKMSRERKVGRTERRAGVTVRASTGNVFADLGLPDAQGHMAKAELAHHLCGLIAGSGLSQAAAAARLGVDQPKVSALMRGRLKDFSTDRLMRFITAMDRDVIIAIRNPHDRAHPTVRVLVDV
jgi:predicted XRE-type DNA-binding protein